ncbi:TrkH family potassium uptake protein [Proteiniborus sp. MB09-C3]|uniref:TrkH family potassium uptake protein n=1 Tax=Proteiniborus sp. MB09-C3 TaxID=3050072 RepID=UPI002552EB35|nr:TrkH family potassium uptake protein [Proteiniborus sp. MB09-C3]WIV11031.1 TrkH family potassium uptake protein [Proteiniborus sp. MB09-C3]
MNYGIVIKVLGNLLLFEAIAFLPPLTVSLFTGEKDLFAFIYSILILLLIGFPMSRVNVTNKRVKARDALLIVTLGWVFASFFGSLPFVFSGSIPSIVDAFFETVSGFTTTGATLVQNVEALPKGIIFWRSFTHWIGGMGILVLTIAILPAIGVGGYQIFKAESPGPITDKIVPKIKDTAKILYILYIGLTVFQTILLCLGGMSLFESLVHTFGTVGTGGFSSRNSSIGAYNSSYIIYVISIFMIVSGVNFPLYFDLYKGRWKNVAKNSELKLYLGIIGISTLLITLNLNGKVYSSILETFKHALFQVSSIITTTGYSTVDFDKWTEFSKTILFLLMFVGGSAGSTGGGIKVVRLLIMGKLVKREISKLLHPRAYIPIKLNGKIISSDVVVSVTSFFFLYMVIFALSTLLISLEGIDFLSATSSVATTLGNIGPGFALVGPTQNFSFFSPLSKALFSLLMLFGRLELFTVFLFFVPEFWKNS